MAVKICDKYFEWLVGIVAPDKSNNHFERLFAQLHNTPFYYTIPLDRNRAYDGRDLRYRFSVIYGYNKLALDNLPHICSVFEMMVALSIRCEEYITSDPAYGDRTSQWFWGMISSLGLNGMYDANYNEDYVSSVITRFLNREYSPDGKGGLFTIKHCEFDVRDVQIWRQLMRYLDSVLVCDI